MHDEPVRMHDAIGAPTVAVGVVDGHRTPRSGGFGEQQQEPGRRFSGVVGLNWLRSEVRGVKQRVEPAAERLG
jgi:hypothetical protein